MASEAGLPPFAPSRPKWGLTHFGRAVAWMLATLALAVRRILMKI